MNAQKISIGVVGLISVVALLLSFGGGETVREIVREGATGGPILNTNYFSFGGIVRETAKDPSLTTASTTVCALQAPSATSTLVSGAIRFTTGSTTQLNVGFGKGDTKFATTTKINDANLTAGKQGTLVVGDPEGASFDEANVFGPDQYLLVQAFGGITAGDDGGGFKPAGTCQAVWERI